MEIISDSANNVLKRREIKVITQQQNTPSFSSAEEIVSKKFNTPQEQIAIKRVEGKFGRDTFLIEAFIYDSAKDKSLIEPKKKEKKKAEEAK